MSHVAFEACLFDLDGTLINSIEAVNRAWTSLARKHNLPVEKVLQQIHGRPASECIHQFLYDYSATYQDEQIEWLKQKEAKDTEGIVAIEGALGFLNKLDESHIPWGIVTSCNRPVAQARMAAVGLAAPKMMVTLEDVIHGKPNPEPYLLGASKLGVNIERCVIFEDAMAGVTSASQAGGHVVAVLSHCSAGDLATKYEIDDYRTIKLTTSQNKLWSLKFD